MDYNAGRSARLINFRNAPPPCAIESSIPYHESFQHVRNERDGIEISSLKNRRMPKILEQRMRATIKRIKYGDRARSVATLRITGDSLMPDEVTRLLGTSPSKSQTKDQELRGKSGHVRVAKFGTWRVHASEMSPADLDAQVKEILSQLTSDFAVWQELATRFDEVPMRAF